MELTLNERLLLRNQYRILKALDPDEAKTCDELCEILENGYVIEYNRMLVGFSTEEFDHKTAREIQEILNMYRMMNGAHMRMEDKTGIDPDALDFKGFDGNDESSEHAYTDFIINTQGRWSEFKKDDLNTHTPMLDDYRRMLAAWNQSADKLALTKDDINRILAAPHQP